MQTIPYPDEVGPVLWNQALVGVAMLSLDGTFKAANPAFCRLIEYTEAELRTKKYQEITHPDDVGFDQLMAGELALGRIESYDMPKRYLTKFGRIVTVSSRVAVIRQQGKAGEPILCFLSQSSPLNGTHRPEPGAEEVMIRVRRKALFRSIFAHWAVVVFTLGLISSIVVQVIEQLAER